ncbi:MAG: LexA family transcriptional regulator [Neisseriaceae bacterium]|nr:MAG: LexA family transcriptional regulator [Neisseriaceae bacterium]
MINKIRLLNLENIINEQFDNNWSKLARALDKSPPYIQAIKSGLRPFSEKNARYFEEKLSLPIGYLDKDHSNKLEDTLDNTFQIPEYDVKLAANSLNGAEVIDPNNIIKHWAIDNSYLDDFRVKPEILAVVQVNGDSMEHTLRSGERVIIDKSKKEAIDNKVFAITSQNKCWVKRVRITPKGTIWQSDNPDYHEYDADLNNGATVRIEGMVLSVLARKID